ncbi:MBL fold metallo-hydrolase [Coprobacillus sp. AF33-1AC]|uniref:MBL fold metallo-hydrolase n=1 Tax=Coprobacillus sp. AF33-1AC TaxID=2292032 RepID=UPI000E478383|nr:MBL fold metallo-hydrolase [Coprobacillus sp. AF33-1AC]RHM63626.1 MBL fold metallo-hydrolase [Coprobacillus sp. AF33-1AC]
MKVIQLTLGMMQSHCYIIYKHNQAIIIDPGDEPEIIQMHLSQNQLNPIAIMLTHGHFDHIGAVDYLVDLYHIPVYLHQDDEKMVYDSQLNLSYFNQPFVLKSKVQHMGKEITLGDFYFNIIHAPGHSEGSVLILCKEEHILFSGDVIFKDSIGRCDFPGSSFKQMQQSLNTIKEIKVDYVLYPGHGLQSTLQNEKKHNPYLSSI